MPIRSRRYDDTFWKELLGKKGVVDDKPKTTDDYNEELGF